jgi:uncharacterized membrane protein HdeD (DUF308 family)
MIPTSANSSKQLTFPAWLIDLTRGLISVGLGLGLLFYRSQTLTVAVWIFALYILVDGILDILAFFRGKGDERREGIRRAQLAIGIASCFAAVLIVLSPMTALTLFLYVIAVRVGFHGVLDLWELITSFRQRELSLLLLIRGTVWIIVSFALILAPRVALDFALNVFAVFFLIDGLGSFASAVMKSRRIPSRRQAAIREQDDASAIGKSPRALVFVRRSGAKGLGHVGWAFEWGTGWFNVGSVEDWSQAAFAPPDKMDFWTRHTLHPVATMTEQPTSYDEFKIFHVEDPQPKAAWSAVVWVSRQSYSVVRRNCADSAYDVLRAYGVENIIDTAQENVPNRWYDFLPGSSHPICKGVEIPLDPTRAARLARLPVREIELHIPTRIKVTPPSWRAPGGRAWYEVQQRARRLLTRSRLYVRHIITRKPVDEEFNRPTMDHGATGQG